MPEDYYIQGFCKVAEDYGVSPEVLLKSAGWWDDMKSFGKDVWRDPKGTIKDFIDYQGNLIGNYWSNAADRASNATSNWYNNTKAGIKNVVGKAAYEKWKKENPNIAWMTEGINGLIGRFRNMDPALRNALLAGGLTLGGSLLFSNSRMARGLAAGGLAGAGAYALTRMGGLKGARDYLTNMFSPSDTQVKQDADHQPVQQYRLSNYDDSAPGAPARSSAWAGKNVPGTELTPTGY